MEIKPATDNAACKLTGSLCMQIASARFHRISASLRHRSWSSERHTSLRSLPYSVHFCPPSFVASFAENFAEYFVIGAHFATFSSRINIYPIPRNTFPLIITAQSFLDFVPELNEARCAYWNLVHCLRQIYLVNHLGSLEFSC